MSTLPESAVTATLLTDGQAMKRTCDASSHLLFVAVTNRQAAYVPELAVTATLLTDCQAMKRR